MFLLFLVTRTRVQLRIMFIERWSCCSLLPAITPHFFFLRIPRFDGEVPFFKHAHPVIMIIKYANLSFKREDDFGQKDDSEYQMNRDFYVYKFTQTYLSENKLSLSSKTFLTSRRKNLRSQSGAQAGRSSKRWSSVY